MRALLTFQAITIWREELLDEKIMLRDVIDLDATFGSSSEEELNAETKLEKFEDSKSISDLNNKTLEENLPRDFNNFVDSNKTEREDKDTETSEDMKMKILMKIKQMYHWLQWKIPLNLKF